VAKVFAIAAFLIGVAGLAALLGYVAFKGMGIAPRPESAEGPVPFLVDVGWLMLFALQHSGMARRGFKRWMPTNLERAIYVAASGIVTLLQLLIWQPLPGANLWQGQYWLLAVSVLGGFGIVYCWQCLDAHDFFGLRQAGVGPPSPSGDGLQVSGAYRWVRHPLMVATLMVLWGQPTMPPELLLLNGGLTLYILVAIRLEERELVAKFGQAYLDYRRRVPALVPWRLGR
jgi:protein-S-isoprenylcysteine O-methyltransferase Ste14